MRTKGTGAGSRVLWLWSQAPCDQDKGHHAELPQQHHSYTSNHHPEPIYCIFIQGHVHLARLTVSFFSLFYGNENRAEDIQLHRFISLFGTVFILFLT